jgi:hypothetical protein
MSGKRIIRFFIGLVLALAILPLVLPLFGVPRSHFLPPAWVYAQAKGQAQGKVIAERYSLSNNPFEVGTRLFFVTYEFRAKPPTGDTRHLQMYYGEIEVNKDAYDAENVNDLVAIKYELTYPVVNGIDAVGGGQGCNPPNNILGPWLGWLVLVLFIAVAFMLIFDRIGAKEDI